MPSLFYYKEIGIAFENCYGQEEVNNKFMSLKSWKLVFNISTVCWSWYQMLQIKHMDSKSMLDFMAVNI